MRGLWLAALLAAAPACAEDLPPAPDYFIEGVFDTTTAQTLALSCPDLSFAIQAASVFSGEVMGRMAQAGFDVMSPDGVQVSGFDAGIKALQDAFVARHGLIADPGTDNVCRAGRAEIAAATGIGRFLIDTAQ